MVRIPSFSRRADDTARDDNGDGRIDDRDQAPHGRPDPAGHTQDSTTYRSASASGASADAVTADRTHDPGSTAASHRAAADRTASDRAAERTASDQAAADRAGADRTASDAETQRFAAAPGDTGRPSHEQRPAIGAAAGHRDDTLAEHRDEEVTVVAGPRPRASLLATLSLILGVAAVLFVLTGTLAGYGIALGVLALLISFGGLAATGRRHVAGKADALLGLLLGLGAAVLGILAFTGQWDWPNTDADTVQRFRDWLDAQTVDRF